MYYGRRSEKKIVALQLTGKAEAVETLKDALDYTAFSVSNMETLGFEFISVNLPDMYVRMIELNMKNRTKEIHRFALKPVIGRLVVIEDTSELEEIGGELVYAAEVAPERAPLIIMLLVPDTGFTHMFFDTHVAVIADPTCEDFEDKFSRLLHQLFHHSHSFERYQIQIADLAASIDELCDKICGEDTGQEMVEETDEEIEGEEVEEELKEIIYLDRSGEEMLLTPDYLAYLVNEFDAFEDESTGAVKDLIDRTEVISISFVCRFIYNGNYGPSGERWSMNYHHYEVADPGFVIEYDKLGLELYSNRISKTIQWFCIDYDNDYGGDWLDKAETVQFFEENWDEIERIFHESIQKFNEIDERLRGIDHQEISSAIKKIDEKIEEKRRELAKLEEERDVKILSYYRDQILELIRPDSGSGSSEE